MADEHDEAGVLAWYDTRRPLFIDLVGDYAGKELFLVEGDSLLRACFEDDRLDFKGGFQMLHAVFVVERFLENLIKRHCQFNIIFFEESKELCIPPGTQADHRSRYLLTRTVVKQHLAKNLLNGAEGRRVEIFSSIESDDFSAYLNVTPVHFVMCHDGAISATNLTETIDASDHQERLQLRTCMWLLCSKGLNIALINRVEFRDSKVFSMIIERGRGRSPHMPPLASRPAASDELQSPAQDHTITETITQILELQKNEDFGGKLVGGESPFSQSLLLLLCSLKCMKELEVSQNILESALVIHVLLLQSMPLSQRALHLVEFDGMKESALGVFLDKYSRIARSILESSSWQSSANEANFQDDLVDLIDGRLFRAVLDMVLKDDGSASWLPLETERSWQAIMSITKTHTNSSQPHENGVKNHGVTGTSEPADNDVSEEVSVMPFTNPVFDPHLTCIHVKANTKDVPSRLAALKIYRETTHWHNFTKPLERKVVPEKVSKWKNPLRLNQFYMQEMTTYAASLTGAKGRVLEPETITVGTKRLAANPPEESKAVKSNKPTSKSGQTASKAVDVAAAGKKGSKKAIIGMSKAEQIRALNSEKKGESGAEKALSTWASKRKDLDGINDNDNRYRDTKAYLDSLDNARTDVLFVDVNMYMVQALLDRWVDSCKSSKKRSAYYAVALIWSAIRSICTCQRPLTTTQTSTIRKICSMLAIEDVIQALPEPSASDRPMSFQFRFPGDTRRSESNPFSIDMDQAEFQLTFCGEYMERQLDAKADARVSFTPDGWQRKVLDELDADNSVFVVAPTSAGKTFISFYAMEQVLRSDDDAVLVYVAPTKALVNQIAAEIQGRFSKKYPRAGKSVWAIHTRDYRVNNPTGCQILVTVPHILQIMLLSPSNLKWAGRVRRIIFDEIHSIGQAEDGVVWEQLLLLSPCPIIALSATVGNPQAFADWLASTQSASGTKLSMIQHLTRYSDLRKYLYDPPTQFSFNGLGKSQGGGLGLDGIPGFTFFHPVSSLIQKTRGMPDDLSLEPRDCLTLWHVMKRCQTAEFRVPEELNLTNNFPPCIRKADVLAWEKKLKTLLLTWMNNRDSPFDKVFNELSSEKAPESNGVAEVAATLDVDDLKATTLPLLLQLHQNQGLPAILFNYDRSGCEDIGKALLEQLKAAEAVRKQGKEWERKMETWQKWKELQEKKAAKKAPKVSKKKGVDDEDKGSKADQAREEASSETSAFDLFDPDEPLDDFSFADKRRCQKAELDHYLEQLKWKRIDPYLIELLQRGIGIHHAGMNRKYRQNVEMLFRGGYLRVVIATGTLALGINMPCATVVFSGDSVFLTALNFRQAAGRAGRRGFDLLGNVVFQGIGRERASRLLSSKLPDLIGHFPLSSSLILRLFTLLHGTNNSPYATKAINSLLSQPRLYLGGESFKEQVLHHLRFSIEYLRRQNLIGPSGQPVNWTSCVSHLYFTENSAFAFHALLKGGYFNELCADIDTKTDQVLQTMMLVLSHIFGRQTTRQIDDETVVERIRRSPSMVYLPPMPKSAAAMLRRHNAETLAIFTSYVKTFATQHLQGEECCLPLTKLPVGHSSHAAGFGVNGDSDHGIDSTNNVLSFLPSLPKSQARSSFVALSGHGDDFRNIADLCSSTRSGVFLEAAAIPHLVLHPDESRTPLNAYLLDFYMHGSVKPLEDANGIRRSDVWFVLNDFSLVLATIKTSLANYLGLSKGAGDDEMLEVMGSGEGIENDKDEEEAAKAMLSTASTTSDTSTATSKATPPIVTKSKKHVAEDWGDDEDALVAREQLDELVLGPGVDTDDEEYAKLMNVFRAFALLKKDFDAKFREIWA